MLVGGVRLSPFHIKYVDGMELFKRRVRKVSRPLIQVYLVRVWNMSLGLDQLSNMRVKLDLAVRAML